MKLLWRDCYGDSLSDRASNLDDRAMKVFMEDDGRFQQGGRIACSLQEEGKNQQPSLTNLSPFEEGM